MKIEVDSNYVTLAVGWSIIHRPALLVTRCIMWQWYGVDMICLPTNMGHSMGWSVGVQLFAIVIWKLGTRNVLHITLGMTGLMLHMIEGTELQFQV